MENSDKDGDTDHNRNATTLEGTDASDRAKTPPSGKKPPNLNNEEHFFDSETGLDEQRSKSPPLHSFCSQGSIETEVRKNSLEKLDEADELNNPITKKSYLRKHMGSINRDSYNSLSSPYAEYPSNIATPPPKQDKGAYAHSFFLALAFFCVWTPQNLMAPNLTQMMYFFKFSPAERDTFLGANIAFATGVLSLPVSALLGFYSDIVMSRKTLFAYTVLGGGVASICTAYSTNYAQLYFARFLCGGFMSGSVPIAFSMLGDLFEVRQRNAASSALTAMMGAGILFGQVFAGTIGPTHGWQEPFIISGISSILTSILVMCFVREPVRGGKEKVLQDMIARGTKYDRTLTLNGFMTAMTKNKTNVILMIQGFTTNIPWGVIFTFLNDYLSQEQGLSVPASTYLVFWFGIGSAFGGIFGGYCGTIAMKVNRSLLPIFMAVSTFLGIFPYLGLLDLDISRPNLLAIFLSFSSGCIANLPSVNVRPCILNVNPPETRGAAMTAANLIINVARGIGPSLVTFARAFFGVSRRYSFNVTIIVFWCITTVLLLFLATTLPKDQDIMDAELARYAKLKMDLSHDKAKISNTDSDTDDDFFSLAPNRSISGDISHADEQSIMSIEDRMQSFDARAANESLKFIGDALREIGEEFSHFRRSTSSQRAGYLEVSANEDGSQEVIWDGGGEYLNSDRRRQDVTFNRVNEDHTLIIDQGFEP